jgi:glucose/arabinose dehydrogenase
MRRLLLALSITATAAVVAQTGGAPAVVGAAPAGFTDVVVSDVSTLTTVEALPDGRVVVLEKNGRLLRIDDQAVSTQVVTLNTFDVCSGSERGLLGFALDPSYVSSGRVYVYRTVASNEPGGCHNRVSAFTMNEDGLDPATEQILVDRISSVNGNHNGGDIEIGNDGFLYIAVGDAGRDPRGDSGSAGNNDAGQDRSLLNGKILRVDRFTGFAAPGNPFTGAGTADCRTRGNRSDTPTSVCREIFSFGLRNPYRFAFDPNTSATRFFINDVGQGSREEVNEGASGANYGWPAREGRCPQGSNPPCSGPQPGFTDPITDYSRGSGLFITGGAFVPNGVWPQPYNGAYLVSDGAFGTTWAWRGGPDLASSEVFLTAAAPTDMAFVTGPSGVALWYVQQNGQVHKVTYDAPAQVADSGPQRYESLDSPARRFDSRAQTPGAPLRAGQTRLVDLSAPGGATAAVVNLALVRPLSSGGFATAWEPRTRRPSTSNVNAPPDSNVSNSSIVPLDEDGNMVLFVQATTHVLIDVAGYFFNAPAAVAAGRFEAVGPERIVDTREVLSNSNDFLRLDDGDTDLVRVPVSGKVGLPSDAAQIGSVAVVLTAVNSSQTDRGFVTGYPTGSPLPNTSNINVGPAPDVRANLVIVPVGDFDSIDLLLDDVDDVAVDVVGYFTGSAAPSATAGRFHLSAPQREVDTRDGTPFDRLSAGTSASVNPSSVVNSASAVAQNLTIARTGGRGFLTAYPGGTLPTVSNINASGAGQVRAALALTRLDSGSETFFSGVSDKDLIVDVLGWFE